MRSPNSTATCVLALAVLLLTVGQGWALLGVEENPMIVTSPHVAAARVGSEATFECTSGVDNDTLTIELQWLYGNSTAVSLDENERVYSVNGTLTIQNAVLEDHGVYTCIDNLGHSANVTLKVYNPDDYFYEGMVIVGINCGLICIFIIGLSYTCYSDRRRHGKDRQCAHAPIVDLTSPPIVENKGNSDSI